MVSTGMKCIKYILFIFNLLFFIAGLVLIVAGALVQTKFQDYFAFFGGRFNSAAILLIVVGFIVFVIGFFGCCGACKENHCMIMTFAVLLGIVFCLEVAAAIAVRLLHNQLGDMVRKNMMDATEIYQQPAVKAVWDKTQEKLACCGSTNYTDWSENEKLANTSSVPDSCCQTVEPNCGYGIIGTQDTYKLNKEGCANKMIGFADDNMLIVGATAIGLALVQIVGIIIACCLAAAVRNDYTPM